MESLECARHRRYAFLQFRNLVIAFDDIGERSFKVAGPKQLPQWWVTVNNTKDAFLNLKKITLVPIGKHF